MPAVAVATREFATAARAQASALGRPDFDAVYVAHPIQDQTREEIEARAEAVIDEIVAIEKQISQSGYEGNATDFWTITVPAIAKAVGNTTIFLNRVQYLINNRLFEDSLKKPAHPYQERPRCRKPRDVEWPPQSKHQRNLPLLLKTQESHGFHALSF